MSSELGPEESLAEGVARVAANEAGAAESVLRDPAGPGTETAHEARKHIKRSRALLRLGKGFLPKDVRRSAGDRLREAAGLLSDARDRQVLARTAASLAAGTFMERAAARLGQADTPAEGERGAFDDAARLLAETRGTLRFTDALEDGFPAAGLRRSYGAGRKAMRRARRDGEAADFHEWRKRAKDLRHQLEFLAPLWPGVLPAVEEDLHRLTDFLGDANDLVMLRAALAEADVTREEEHSRAAALHRLAERRDEGWKHALRSGARLYAEKPDAFVARMKVCWKAARCG